MLLHETAHLGVEIDRVLFQRVELIEDLGAVLDAADDETGGRQLGDAVIVGEDCERVVIGIDGAAQRVARVARAEDRQDQIGAGRDAPGVKGLSEISRLPVDAAQRHHVHHAAEPDGGVDDESPQRNRRTPELALKQIVKEEGRLFHVVEHVVNRFTPIARHHRDIGLRGGLEDPFVEKLIEREGLAVEGLKRIVRPLVGGTRRGISGRCGATAERTCRQQRGQPHPTPAPRGQQQGNTHERFRNPGMDRMAPRHR